MYHISLVVIHTDTHLKILIAIMTPQRPVE